ncbi:Beta-lactamase/D-alanine carboxypeptidase [Pseudomonas coronafaciens pv. coronafaciens]|nr:Beta-lactamase/D-alanine carboxypeptidase [Pseudomonas coronafaciens pv. coronafaciens]
MPRRNSPNRIMIRPPSNTVASRYCTPCCTTSATITTAIEPAAPDTIPGLPPNKAVSVQMMNAPYSPISGLRWATSAKAMHSGTRANDVVSPARTSARIRIVFMIYLSRVSWRKRKKGGILRKPLTTDHRREALSPPPDDRHTPKTTRNYRMQWNGTLFCTGLLLVNSVAFAGQDPAAFDALVQTEARKVMQENNFAGLSIAITRNGEQQFYNYGVASKATGRPVSSDTLFELGSISKTFTATLASWAQANGQLSLTQSIATYIPQLGETRLGKIPVFHLATHTAGGFPLQVPEQVHDTDQLMAWFKAWQPEYLPGTHRTYANPSVGLLGMIAARSMHLPYEKALQQRLFPALGLNSTYVNVPDEKQGFYAQGYNKLDEPARVSPGPLAAEAYGVKSSSRDMIRFVEANIGTGQYDARLRRALSDTQTGYFRVASMTQDLIWEQYSMPVHLEQLLTGNASAMLTTLKAEAIEPPQAPQPVAWINKTGSTNGFGGYVAFIPEKQLGIVILANKNYPNEQRVRLAYRILDELGCCSKP